VINARRDASAKQNEKATQSVRPRSMLDWSCLYVHYYNKRERSQFSRILEFPSRILSRRPSPLTRGFQRKDAKAQVRSAGLRPGFHPLCAFAPLR